MPAKPNLRSRPGRRPLARVAVKAQVGLVRADGSPPCAKNASPEAAIAGCLLGGAVGDALGLPYEGLDARRARRLLGAPVRHRFLPGAGMVSDDTEHALLTARALIESRGDPELFARSLARGLRLWLLGLPAGVGLATLRACARLCLGVPPARSGVFSAGNGPAMRAPVIGVAFGSRPERMRELVRVATRITHTDPRAEQGALAVALAAALSAGQPEPDAAEYLARTRYLLDPQEAAPLVALLERAVLSAARGEPVSDFAAAIGCRRGVSGFTLHTVPCVVQVWLRHTRDYRGAVSEMIAAGGDTDTCGAILGGIIGARVGKGGIPAAWLAGVREWPRSPRWMERLAAALAAALAGDGSAATPRCFAPALPLRNALFALVVLGHGLRRLAPPY